MGGTLDLLQRPTGTLSVLRKLAEPGEHQSTALVRELGYNPSSLYRVLERLEELGLVYEESDQHGHMLYSLTRSGARAAVASHVLEEVMDETLAGYEQRITQIRAEGLGGTPEAAKVFLACAEAAITKGLWDRGAELARETAQMAEARGDTGTAARAHLLLGQILQRRGERGAERVLAQALQMAIKASRPDLASEALYFQGSVKEGAGEPAAAEGLYREAAGYASKANDPVARAHALLGLGRIQDQVGLYDACCKTLEEAIALLEGAGQVGEQELARAFICMGAAAVHANRDPLPWYEKAVPLARQAGDIRLVGYALANMGGLQVKQRKYRQAERALLDAQGIFQTMGERKMIASVRLHLGSLSSGKRDWAGARSHFEAAASLYKELGDRQGLADAFLHEAKMRAACRESTAASRLYRQAGSLFASLGNDALAEFTRRERDALSSGTKR